MDSTLGDKAKEVFEFQTKMSDLKKTSSRSVRQKGQKKLWWFYSKCLFLDMFW